MLDEGATVSPSRVCYGRGVRGRDAAGGVRGVLRVYCATVSGVLSRRVVPER
jgi:hypothetical protein